MNFILLSTTAKHNKDILKLPPRNILNQLSENFLISSKEKLKNFVESNSRNDIIFLADCEKKQDISIYDELLKSNAKVLDYKPNDLTMEAADLAVLNYFNRDVNGKSIAIYGTGNIAFKLALRLSERNADIYLFGRNKDKLKVSVKALKQVSFNADIIHYGHEEIKVDSLVSFVSKEEAISEKYLNILKENTLCLDGGIGNFSKKFIKEALEEGHDVRRLDVRQSQEIMDGYINSRLNSEFDKIIGRDEIEGQSIIAGGIMGQVGEIIVDKITEPTKVIGIANGIGGVKNESELSDEEKIKMDQVQSYIEQNI